MNRRDFLSSSVIALVALSLNSTAIGRSLYNLSKQEWKEKLSALEYAVMRDEKTERAGTSPLLNEKRAGIYHCKGCDLPLYDSSTKYDSRTGWPSFYQALPSAVDTKEDRTLFAMRTEVHCKRCKSHLGHIFDDGPKPTGKRHCLNGISLVFHPVKK
ncbi:MAG: peptide-methionine (R)-S-oxide reductase [Candidatus Endobugula sp.]|jgi:peptide-methionine (R)-S-oxide reductase